MTKALAEMLTTARRTILKPREKLSVSDWADAHRVLSSRSSAQPGRWRTSTTEYLRQPMNDATDPEAEIIVLMFAAQMAKSEMILNCIGRTIDLAPCPMLVVQPSISMCRKFSKQRLQNLFDECEVLCQKIPTNRSSRTISETLFPGGFLALVSANSPASLASMPIKHVFCDEIDRYPEELDKEGDVIELALRRTATFRDRKAVLVSTPTVAGHSKIERWYSRGSQSKLHVPCSECGVFQELTWRHVEWDKDEQGRHLPETARIQCEHCGAAWDDVARWRMIKRGVWVDTVESRRIKSYQISELYSSWARLSEIVTAYLSAKRTGALREFTNLRLGLPWDPKSSRTDGEGLRATVEDFDGDTLPPEIEVLTAGVDVQGDRLECQVVGHAQDGQRWNVDYQIFNGATDAKPVWADLAQYLKTTFYRIDDVPLPIAAVGIDAGFNTQRVLALIKSLGHPRAFPLKGYGGRNTATISFEVKRQPRSPVHLYNSWHFKAALFQLIKDGHVHFPRIRAAEPQDYFESLCSEVVSTKYRNGYATPQFKKIFERNEALDTFVLASVSLTLLNPDFEALRVNNLKKTAYKTEKTVLFDQKDSESPVFSHENAKAPGINTSDPTERAIQQHLAQRKARHRRPTNSLWSGF